MSAAKSEPCPLTVLLTAKDMKASVAFYRDTLGFEMKEAWPSKDDPWWCSLHLAGQTIMLGLATDDCGGAEEMSDSAQEWMQANMQAFKDAPRAGVGVFTYVMVPDVDAFHAEITARGAKPHYEPKTQFYGIRDFSVTDPTGYDLVFYTNVKMESCQSCGMPLADAKLGQMYCQYCTDEKDELRPYEAVFEGTVTGYFMGMQKMERAAAEEAARDHLSKMPAWVGRS